MSPETLDKLAPQRRQPGQIPRTDVGKTSKAAAAKTLAVNCVLLVLVVVANVHDIHCVMLNAAFLLVLVDVYEYA